MSPRIQGRVDALLGKKVHDISGVLSVVTTSWFHLRAEHGAYIEYFFRFASESHKNRSLSIKIHSIFVSKLSSTALQ
jgi:hypothetical protein